MNVPALSNSMRVQTWVNILQDNGYRLTQPRLAVLNILAESDHAVDAVEIFDRARNLYSSLSLVSVYRTLEKLEELGLVTRVHRDEHCHAFVAGLEGHQHILICEICGKVFHFSGDDVHNLVNKVEKDSGFSVTSHWLQLFGQCKECQGR